MPNLASKLRQHRRWLAAAGLLGLSTALVVTHDADDPGLSADEITPQRVREQAAALHDAGVSIPTTGHVLVDFVEPDDGEGGSEDEIAEAVAAIDALEGVDLQPAGFYSEGEHLYRLLVDPTEAPIVTLADATQTIAAHELVEGHELELVYELPSQITESGSDIEDDIEDGIEDGAEPPELEPNKPPRFQPNDPMYHLQWHMEMVRGPEAWTKQRGDGAIVAVIDTGVAYETAKGVNQLPDLAGTKFTEGESFITGLPKGLDDHAHGSHVAGTIAQTTDNGIGVAGVAFESTIMPLKVLTKDGRGSVGAIANAVRYAADHGAHVINMSLGGPLPSNVLAKAIAYAHSKGVTTVCAAGNERRSRVGYPAANKHAVAVSSVDLSRGLAWYSNWGKDIDVAAPGGDTRDDRNGDGHPDGVLQNTIKVQQPLDNDYLWFQGTSMASPHAAGVAALIVGAGVTNPDEVERLMKKSAVHPDGVEWDQKFGAGIVDAAAAVDAAQAADYAPERAGLAGLLALLGLAGFGLGAIATRRGRMLGIAGLTLAAAWASGAVGTTPLAYGLAGMLGGLGGLGGFGSVLWMSALVPAAATLLLLSRKGARPILAGLNLGYAALLTHGALVLPTLIGGVPGGPVVDRLWLAANALVALWLAHRVSRK